MKRVLTRSRRSPILFEKSVAPTKEKRTLAAMLRVFSVATVDGAVIQDALELPRLTLEGTVTAAAA